MHTAAIHTHRSADHRSSRHANAAIALLAFVGLASLAAPALGAVDNTWDWTKNKRTLYLKFDPGVTNYKIYDPTNRIPNIGGSSLADAYFHAANSWNNANNGANAWRFAVGNPMDDSPVITIRLGTMAGGGGGGGGGGGEFVDPPSFGRADMDKLPGGGGGGGGGPSNALAFFRLLNRDAAGGYTSAEIVINPFTIGGGSIWGVAKNLLNNRDAFDPVINGLHELGHALRLDHESPKFMGGGLDDTINAVNKNGLVMRPYLDRGVYETNKNMAFDWNPHSNAADPFVTDVAWASASAVPAPGSAALLALAGVCLARRRR
ncbi:MAG: PEP-CTERM sorting domain-containing protein [Planctomycetota bacterium]|nr:PEP-CTERM sorting domain-containing protein [Planctomycetota bacterium]